MTTAIKTSLSLSALAAVLLSVACGGLGNTGQAPPSDALIEQIPWTNGVIPLADANGVMYTSALPAFPPIGQDLPDPGSLPVDCDAASENYEFAPWVASMEPDQYGGSATDLGLAIRWAGADDLTRGSWRSPGFTTWYPGLMSMGLPWGTPAQSVSDPGRVDSRPFPPGPVPVCNHTPNNNVLHMRGAGFRYYGGNVAHILAGDNYGAYDETDCPKLADGTTPSDLCHAAPKPGATVDSAGFPLVPTKNDVVGGVYQLQALHTYFDASKYEGVSFWARRGPDSMGSLLVTVNDKYTSDDMNRQNETYCRRFYACHSGCLNPYAKCRASVIDGDLTNDAANPVAVMRCFDPSKGMPLPSLGGSDNTGMGSTDDLLDALYPRCGNTCTFRKTYPDADLEGKACQAYTFTSGESGEYCFNDSDPPPPSREERCVDGFTSTVQLTGDWKLYTLPFSEMRQGGYGKHALEFDLHSVYSLTLGWGAGNVDFYIDNVSLYRVNKH